MPGSYPVQLSLFGGSSVMIGAVSSPGDLPELLLHIAEHFDSNPQECAAMFKPQCRGAVAPEVAQPFMLGSDWMGAGVEFAFL